LLRLFVKFVPFFFIFIKFIYPQDLEQLRADLENYWLLGHRPLFLGAEYYINARGHLFETNSTTDFAIFDDGFFVLYDSINKDIILTRNGSFQFNIRGYLVNHKGFYVLKNTSDIRENVFHYIRHDELFFDADKKMEPDGHLFLIMMPVNKDHIITISPEYIKSLSNAMIENSRIYNGFLEAMPVNLEILLSYANGLLLAKRMDISIVDKKYCLELAKERYSELLELNNAGELNSLEQTISIFEKLLYLYPAIEEEPGG
jgi:hypothetical protein